ncbi:hypothetical protein HIM_10316 [Hirsutella minnesotensis 3608]|uniref:Uncharacterized protein n=1 Tax=Hirsutella minnesotensis 3608 TaxID=1043627 RepID=A0A0F8A2F7_9HYPO|nr:hypothetical protein HIM_10316 [Hirsutella minnesotensis 3608]
MATATPSPPYEPDPFDLGIYTPNNLARGARAALLRDSSPAEITDIGLSPPRGRTAQTPSSPLTRMCNAANAEGQQLDKFPALPTTATQEQRLPIDITHAATQLIDAQAAVYNAKLRPLDVSLFGPLSIAYTNQLIQWTAKTQGLIGLSKREFWSLFWDAFGSSFSAENIASGWKRTGLLPFDPEVVLSQITEKTEDDSESGNSSVDSLALDQPTARDLRRLVDKVVDKSSKNAKRDSRKLRSTLESLQSQNELLRYENQGLRETIFHEKQRRMRGKALKDYLFDRVDPNSAQVFSPAKVAQARLRKAAMETQKQEEALEKERQKFERQQKAAKVKALTLEKRRQREAETEQRRQAKEAKRQEQEKNRQIRKELQRNNREAVSEMESVSRVAPQTREKSPGVRDEIIVAISALPEPPTAPEYLKSPNGGVCKGPKSVSTTFPIPQKPSLAVESDREIVAAIRGLGRSGRNRRRPRWLDDCEMD